jgi:hypothetical protein
MDAAACEKLWAACTAELPNVQVAEIVDLAAFKARRNPNARNLVGLLLTSLPDLVRAYRARSEREAKELAAAGGDKK